MKKERPREPFFLARSCITAITMCWRFNKKLAKILHELPCDFSGFLTAQPIPRPSNVSAWIPIGYRIKDFLTRSDWDDSTKAKRRSESPNCHGFIGYTCYFSSLLDLFIAVAHLQQKSVLALCLNSSFRHSDFRPKQITLVMGITFSTITYLE